MTRYNDDPLKRSSDGKYEMSNTQYIKWVGYTVGADAVTDYIGCLHPETTLEDVILSIQGAIGKGLI